MHKLLTATVAVLIAIAGCGSQSIEDRVRSEYPDYAKRHHIDAKAQNVDRVTCTNDATTQYDGWCSIHPKGFKLTYDVPYKDDKVLWGESGLMEAPS